ncbi:MAG: RidA family protein [Propionibacteriales bacterium]|nr:RidA family protein [Propionibacteriales bacterium]
MVPVAGSCFGRPGSLGVGACHPERVTRPAIELIRLPDLTDRAPYAYAAVASDISRLIFTAGACPLDETGQIAPVGDITGQTELVIANVTTALTAAGATLTDVVKTTVYVASHDRQDLLAAWNGVRKAFDDHDVPSTLLGVAVLGYPDQLVEVEAIAALREPAAST